MAADKLRGFKLSEVTMPEHVVRVYKSAEGLPREKQLAWKIAEVAADPVPVDADVEAMIINRIIDNSGVATAGIARRPVANARAQAIAHPHAGGSTVYGLPADQRFSCEWAAWANSTAVRELDFHDTFLAADGNHPGDMLPALIAVGQQAGVSGKDLIRGAATAYEVCVSLAKAISLNKHRIDHLTHLAAGAAAGLGTMLKLPVETIFQAVNHAVHVTVTTRQSRKGLISTWKAVAPAHAGKLAVEAIDRAMRGETSPSPIYEGEDSIIAWVLDGPDAEYAVPLPGPGESKRAILETYTKAYSAEIQSQAWIDLAFRLRDRVGDTSRIKNVVMHTSHHTHWIIGSGSGDPEKYQPEASRETLDHSVMYIFTVALQDGRWHHIDSYTPERAKRPDTVRLWQATTTVEDPEWTRRYHEKDPAKRAFGGRVVITFEDGSVIEDSIDVADAHPLGARPYGREDYVGKFRTLARDIATPEEIERFLVTALDLGNLAAGELSRLTVEVPADVRDVLTLRPGLFELSAS